MDVLLTWFRIFRAAPALYRAALILEHAEDFNANECPNADDHGDQMPELCEYCFPYFDDARIARRNALAKIAPAQQEGNEG